jgi:nucleosome assembly protein 1-like 1
MMDNSGSVCSEHFAEFVASHNEIKLPLKNLQKLHLNYLALNRRYQEELLQLQNKSLAQYNACFAQRQEIVNGQNSQPNISGFWLTAMSNNIVLSEAIEPAYEEALSFLRDIRIQDLGNTQGFTLVFDFNDNPFFRNKSLLKTFVYEYGDDYTGALRPGQATGCQIDWKPGKNLTTQHSQSKSKAYIATVVGIPADSLSRGC